MATNAGLKPPRGGQASDADPESAAAGRRPGPWPPRIEPLPPDHGHNPKVLKSWARRTGYKSTVSGETAASSNSDVEISNADSSLPKPLSQLRPKGAEKATVPANVPKGNPKSKATNVVSVDAPSALRPPAGADRKAPEPDQQVGAHQIRMEPHRGSKDSQADMLSQSLDTEDVLYARQSHMKYEIRENPGIVPLVFYGLQHYLSIIGSIILIPLVIVPAMGGSDEDTARVVSTVLLITGLATLMHTFLGSRLPLIQGPSFVYLAPALAIINSKEFQSISTDRFKHTMRELQGAIIISSGFQVLLGYSGLMSVLLRLVNPVVVTPTIAAVGLAFFTYGFPVVGSCVEIGIPQILVVVFFALYMRKISVFGHRIFQVYAVPLGLGIVWAYAFLLTEAGAYNYKGCSVHVPSSNIISEECRRHVFTMMHCRTDASVAMKTAAWFRFPYPFQWGIPSFHWRTACLMIVASIVATVDSVGSYHASSLLVAARAPTPGVVSRAIGLEGLTSTLAGIWGIGTGASTLTENVHTIAVTKMGSRRAVEFGACVLILMSLVGKIGAFIASIPQVIVAGVLCIMWTMLTAFGLSNLRYSETGSSRNVIIVGLSLFLSLSVPVYFQHYAAGALPATVASYFQPYTVAAHGPIQTGIEGLDFLLNTVLSMHMVIAFLVAFVLDNTVPGSRHERGTYVWSKPRAARREPAVVKDYSLPPRLAKFFSWARWVGL
ncbi:hypothetical protein GOP47_0014513 [Adiantum capillus-veneris]|uniref:Nucleobase-ascorbate transporter 12 n=1 Tax=Adiantum capillus-veneris TaxID=13818 RepID=A0A9D4ULL5_ADICA|nr:hypothetical protein GOP47_0014513 [Adiantum capillus-veneris]